MTDAAGLIAEAGIVLLVRSGAIAEADVLALADEYDRRAGWAADPTSQASYVEAAHRLRSALLSVPEAPRADPAVEFRAAYERRQMRERTAILARDGGKRTDD